jgi:Family of unknown function (DUF6152)
MKGKERIHMLKGQAGVWLIAGALLAAAPAWAHHSFAAEFDADKPIKLTGTLTKVEWVNPHAWFHIDVKSPDGQVTSWMIEAGSPNILLRRGFTRDTLQVGTVLVVTGYQAKDASNRANGKDITFPDGRKLLVGSSNGPDAQK